MCVPDGSVDLYTSTCPMCKVFRHSGPRCPHKRETCRNRANHPRHDVIYLTNAEVQTFKGCGYCKWAQTTPAPPANRSGMANPGWPGCCRPPPPSDYVMIPPADWPAVNCVHRTPIPGEIKQLLDTAMKIMPHVAQSGSLRGIPSSERKTLGRTNSSPNGTVRSPPSKSRGANGSPQMHAASLVGSAPRYSGAQPGASPSGNGAIDPSVRRLGPNDTPLKRIEGFRTTPPASIRKLVVDGDGGTLHHPPVSRPSLAAAHQPSAASLSPGSTDPASPPSLKRRGSNASAASAPLAVATNRVAGTPKSSTKSTEQKAEKAEKAEKTEKVERTGKSENAGLEKSMKALSVGGKSESGSSGGGSRGSSAGDNSTVTSDGGFTDYLSDESEAELQRQAEVRAAILEQNRMEDQEFKAARQQLATIDLKPPQVWTTGVAPPRKAMNAAAVGGGYTRARG